jgi:hypothetical protein
MKIRVGFVSNSSSCNFCIYGVRFEYSGDKYVLEEPDDDAYSIERDAEHLKLNIERAEIETYWGGIKDKFYVFGVGNVESERDHFDLDWEQHVPPEPTKEEMTKFDELIKSVNPELKAEIYSGAYRD